jgi:hypothetical protein
MMYETDQILLEHWAQEEREKRLKEGKKDLLGGIKEEVF